MGQIISIFYHNDFILTTAYVYRMLNFNIFKPCFEVGGKF